MTLQDALALFRRLGVHPEVLSRSEFSMAYFRLARRYHPDVNPEISPNFGDGLGVQAAAVWDCKDVGLAATSIPSVNLTP
jgi:hypothetical protein